MPRPGGNGAGSDKPSLQRLHDLALWDAQRPGNIGAGLKLLEALMNTPNFRPVTGGRA
jgi:hypothetical protein